MLYILTVLLLVSILDFGKQNSLDFVREKVY